MRNFVSFALDPSSESATRLPLTNQVELGLGQNIKSVLKRSDAPLAEAWTISAPSFRAYSGPFSALELIQRHAEESEAESVGGRGPFQLSVGEHPHCAGLPAPSPRKFKHHRRVSVQPSGSSIDSCLSWFSVDLFLDTQGNVAAVTLDLWEP